ncbi:hypothetical protein SNE40_014615 [Patella caerulea]|uniref:Uncharacterized protein n=1 Tax=Patella caerulea TaxID=87958 RepID=A0AAN8PJE1_PATCE
MSSLYTKESMQAYKSLELEASSMWSVDMYKRSSSPGGCSKGQFCLDRNLQLKSTHRYYSQIQFQMYISKLTFCDFVVHKNCRPAPSMVIVRVALDVAFCKTLISRWELIIKTFIIMELVTRELENQKEETSALNNQGKVNNFVTRCICSEPEYGGEVIKCDNSDCPYGWIHYINVLMLEENQEDKSFA